LHSQQNGDEDVVRRKSFCSLGSGDTVMPLCGDKPETQEETHKHTLPLHNASCAYSNITAPLSVGGEVSWSSDMWSDRSRTSKFLFSHF